MAVCCVLLPLHTLLFWATVLLWFFFYDYYQFWEGDVYHVYVELIELIYLPLRVYSQLCLGLSGKRAAAPGKSAEPPAR